MPDLSRSLAALVALFADNTSGDISAQDARDALVSAYKPQGTFGHRPSLEAGVSVSTTDQTGKSVIYFTPHPGSQGGDRMGLFDGTSWVEFSVPSMALAGLTGLTSARNYDLFVAYSTPTHSSTDTGTEIVTWSANPGWTTGTYIIVTSTGGGLTAGTNYWYNRASSTTGSFHTTLADAVAGTNKVNLTANITQTLIGVFADLGPTWNTGSGSDTARGTGAGSTALTTQNGVYVNSVSVTGSIGGGTIAATAGLYVGSIRTTGTTTTEHSAGGSTTKVGGKMFLWSLYNRVERQLIVKDTTDSWSYSTNAFRISNGATAPDNCVEYLCGLLIDPVEASAIGLPQGNSIADSGVSGIGIDGTSNVAQARADTTAGAVFRIVAPSYYVGYPGLGYHYIAWLENTRVGTLAWAGDLGGSDMQSGMKVRVMG